jgi:hypothetical protein
MDGRWTSEPTSEPHQLWALRKSVASVRRRVDKIIDAQFQRSMSILRAEKVTLTALSEAIFEQGRLDGEEIMSIFTRYPTFPMDYQPAVRPAS